MKQHRRRLRRTSDKRRSAFFASTDVAAKRVLRTEQLESRQMLAGDLISPYHNLMTPTDVNNDGYVAPIDALMIINELNARGSYNLLERPANASGAEGESSGPIKYYDTNNDGYLTPLDALIVINALHAEGEGENDIVRFFIIPYALGTDTPITTIAENQDFELRILVDDVRPLSDPGVYAAWLDIITDTENLQVYVNEIQHINILGNPTGGTFTLTFDGQTTAPITYTTSPNPANSIKSALEALPNIGAGNVEVVREPGNRFRVKFVNALGNTDVPALTVNANLTGGTSPTATITETAQGTQNDPVAFRNAFLPADDPDIEYSFGDQATADLQPGLWNDIGSVSDSLNLPDTNGPIELARVRLRALDGGTYTFIGDVYNVLMPAHQTLVFANAVNPNDRSDVPPENIGIYRSLPTATLDPSPAFIIVTEPVSAEADSFTAVEDTPINLPVLANDSATPGGIIRITGLDATGTAGTIQVVDPNNTPNDPTDNQIRFTPAPNFVGTTTFRYEIGDGRGNREWATVTVTVTGVNDPPVITLPGAAPVATEDVEVIITGLSVADIDAGTGQLQVVLTANTPLPDNGVITLATTAGLANVIGNGTDGVVSFRGTLADINAALNGLKWLPPANYNGEASITVEVNDLGNSPSNPLTDTKVINLNVAPVNDPPVNVSPVITLTVVEGDSLTFAAGELSISDPDAAETPNAILTTTLTAQWGTFAVTAAGHGATVTGDGTSTLVLSGTVDQINAALVDLEYTPVADSALEVDSVTMVTNDNGNTGPIPQEASSTITIEISTGVLPRARRDSATVAEDSAPVVIPVLDNDLTNSYEDPVNPGQFLKEQPYLVSVTQPVVLGTSDPAGTVSINDNGTPADPYDDFIEFQPAPNFFGTATFTYTMNESDHGGDGLGADAIGVVTVTVTPVNDAPTAADDAATTDEDTPIDIAVLANDEDVDGDVLTPIIVTQPINGTATPNPDGTIKYTPHENFNGTDTFEYQVSDGTTTSNVVTVTVTVNPVDDAPVAVADSYNAIEDTPLVVPAAEGVLENDYDIEGSSLTAILVTDATKGSVTLNSDGSFTYTPNQDANGIDTFTYKVNDGALDSAPVTVTINIAPVNDAPVANDDPSYTTNEDVPLVITTRANGVLGNDEDVETQSTLTAVLVSGPSNGQLTLNPDGTFTYTPNPNFNGVDSFTYKADDGEDESNVATVTITVNAVNDAPVGVPDSYAGADEDTVFTAPFSVLDNDTDPDSGEGDTKSAVAETITSAKGATVVMQPDGTFTYDPRSVASIQALPEGGSTTDTFTYTVRDAAGATSTATVTITIGGKNDAPTANPDAFGAIANVPTTFNVLANDTDIDSGDTRTIQSVDSPSALGATITFDASGNITYTAPAGTSGTDTFTYTIVDSHGATSTATVTVSVQNFVPTDISGYVYIDKTTAAQPGGNGVFEAGERGVANVTVVLSSPTGKDMFGNDFTPRVAVTDANGYYVFEGIVPGNYVITQIQPQHLRDGLEGVTDGQYASVASNDVIAVNLPQLGAANGKVENNNFAELGIDASSLDNSAGLMQELLASSSQNGLVISTNLAGDDFWFYALNNWPGLTHVDVSLSANLSTLTIKATVNGVQKTATLTQTPNSQGGRFRVLGYTNEGGYIIRIDGQYTDFQWAVVPQAEGEAAGDADATYVNSVDQVLTEQSWA